MEKKDWRGDLLKIGEIPDGSEETVFVEFHLDTLNDFIKKVVDKAREEGYDQGVKDGMKGRVFKKVEITEEIHVPEEFLDKAREEGRKESKREYAQAIATGQKVELTEELVDRIWSANLEEMYKMGLTKLLKTKEDGK